MYFVHSKIEGVVVDFLTCSSMSDLDLMFNRDIPAHNLYLL